MDIVRSNSKRLATVYTGKAVGRECEKNVAAVCGGVVDGDRSDLVLGDRMSAVAGRTGQVQELGIRDEKFGGVVMSENFGNVGFSVQGRIQPCFRGSTAIMKS